LAAAGAAGSWVCTYRHERTGEVLTVILLCGRPGPMSVHRPEHCYRGAGYDIVSPAVRPSLELSDGTSAEFWTAVFSKPGPGGPSRAGSPWAGARGRARRAPGRPPPGFPPPPPVVKVVWPPPLAPPRGAARRGARRGLPAPAAARTGQGLGPP